MVFIEPFSALTINSSKIILFVKLAAGCPEGLLVDYPMKVIFCLGVICGVLRWFTVCHLMTKKIKIVRLAIQFEPLKFALNIHQVLLKYIYIYDGRLLHSSLSSLKVVYSCSLPSNLDVVVVSCKLFLRNAILEHFIIIVTNMN